MLSSKTNKMYSKNKQRNKCVCIYNEIRLITMKTKMKKKNQIDMTEIDLSLSVTRSSTIFIKIAL